MKSPLVCIALLFVAMLMARPAPGADSFQNDTAQAFAMSDAMRKIVASLKRGDYDLDVSKLPKADKADMSKLAGDKTLEKYELPEMKGAADMFSYTIYFDKAHGKYWVTRTGGFAGVRELYGPVDVK